MVTRKYIDISPLHSIEQEAELEISNIGCQLKKFRRCIPVRRCHDTSQFQVQNIEPLFPNSNFLITQLDNDD